MPVAPPSEGGSLPLQHVREELLAGLRAGADIDAESLLARYPALAEDAEAAADLITAEYAFRRERGEAPDAGLWLLLHLRWGVPLRRRLEEIGALPAAEVNPTATVAESTVAHVAGGPATVAHVPRSPALEALGPLPPHRRLERIGIGGMGAVYRAIELSIGREVALKTIKEGAAATIEERRRFRREVMAAGRLGHPNIVPVYSVGTFEGEDAFTMPLYPAGTLAKELARGRPSMKRAAAVLALLARAVHHAHQNGIIHRDLKPANVLIGPGGSPHVGDFGLAILQGGETLTAAGIGVGTPSYMAPEQTRSSRVGPAADVWALGVILYECLTGVRPFQGTQAEITSKIRSEPPLPPRVLVPAIPPGLEAIVLRCLAKQEHARLASAGVLAEALEKWLAGDPEPVPQPTPPRRRQAALLSLGLLCVPLLMGAVMLGPTPEPEPGPTRKEAWLKWVEKELKAGRAVKLVGATGHPRWYEWRTQPNRTELEARKGPMRFEAFEMTQLELLPSIPIKAYRVEAEVSFFTGPPEGVAGLYVFGTETAILQGQELNLYRLGFSRTQATGPIPRTGPCHYRPAAPSVSKLHFPEDRPVLAPSGLLAAASTFGPLGNPGGAMGIAPILEAALTYLRPDTFRALAFTVTERGITASFDGVPIDSATSGELGKFLGEFNQLLRLAQMPVVGRPAASFPVDGRIGLFITKGTVLFRNVRIVPLLSR